MNKIIVVESCRTCPYMGYYRRNQQYICMILSKDISIDVEDNVIDPECKLDEAIVENKHFNNSNVIASEGIALCKQIPENDSFNEYLIGTSYNFKRQIDGNIRLYHYGIDAQRYMIYPAKVFEKYFQIENEQSVNINTHEICPECRRPKRFCECL